MTTATAADQVQGYGTGRYRTYVLAALTLIYILNFVDRGLLAVVGPDLVPELGISDTQFGLLTGFGFALLYTIVGIPLARFADTGHRVWLMTVCIALWSIMTVLCGLATEVTIGSVTIGAFWILLACRVGVGIVRVGVRQIFNGVMSLEGACRTIAAGSQSVRDTPHLMETVQVMETVLEVEERTRGAKRTTILDSQKSSQISPLVWAILCLPVQITARVLF